MSKYQQEWKELLQSHEAFKEWKVRASGGDLLIRVPEDTDMDMLRNQFSDVLAPVSPLVKSPGTTLRFYVGNSEDTDFVFTLN